MLDFTVGAGDITQGIEPKRRRIGDTIQCSSGTFIRERNAETLTPN